MIKAVEDEQYYNRRQKKDDGQEEPETVKSGTTSKNYLNKTEQMIMMLVTMSY